MSQSSDGPVPAYRKRFDRRTESPLALITMPFDGRRRFDAFLAVQAAAAGADFGGGVTVGGLTIGPDGVSG